MGNVNGFERIRTVSGTGSRLACTKKLTLPGTLPVMQLFSPQLVDNQKKNEKQYATADTGKINPYITYLCTAVIEQLKALISQGTQQTKKQTVYDGMEVQLSAHMAQMNGQKSKSGKFTEMCQLAQHMLRKTLDQAG